MSELKDYSILDIEAIDDDRFKKEKAPGKWVSESRVYLKEDVDETIAELKDKCQMHDFFWDGCGFAKRGFKNTIAVSEAFDRLEAENRRLKRALYKACANWAKAMDFYEDNPNELWSKMKYKCRAKAEASK